MASKKIFLVFILPIIFSVTFASFVMYDILQKPDRELNMWPTYSSGGHSSHSKSIEIQGLEKQYSPSDPVEIRVSITDSSFDCGDLYITIRSSDSEVVTQGGFFEQCFEQRNETLPIGEEFSKIIKNPGSYEIKAEMVSKDLSNISIKEKFTVK